MYETGEILLDLVYNKFWTHNESAQTNNDGQAIINGFYGDYDVTVTTPDGKTQKVMAAFHSGYENELEIILK